LPSKVDRRSNVKRNGAFSLRDYSGDATRKSLQFGQAGSSPRRATYFFCFAKRSRQEKATPTVPPPLRGGSRAASTEIGKAAKLASLRQGGLLIRFRHCRHGGTQTGTHVKSSVKSNGNRNRNRNGNGNGNCRCAYVKGNCRYA
jgi:hypothetical protein